MKFAFTILILLLSFNYSAVAQMTTLEINNACDLYTNRWVKNTNVTNLNTNSCNVNDIRMSENNVRDQISYLYSQPNIAFTNNCFTFEAEFDYKYDGNADGLTFFFASSGFTNPGSGQYLAMDSSLRGLVLYIDLWNNGGAWDPAREKLISLLNVTTNNQYQETFSTGIVGNSIKKELIVGQYYNFKIKYQRGIAILYIDNQVATMGFVTLNNQYGTFGFTASTGNSFADQYIRNFKVSYLANYEYAYSSDTICENVASSYRFRNKGLDSFTPGIYNILDTAINLSGCDTIHQRNVNVRSNGGFTGLAFNASASAQDNSICAGETTKVSLNTYIASYNFNNQQLPPGWSIGGVPNFSNNTCGFTPDNSPYYWSSSSGIDTPYIATNNLNICDTGTISFMMKYGIQGDSSSCDGPSASNEGVSIEYSIDNGATWTEFVYYQPDGSILTNNPNTNSSTVSGPTRFTSWNTYTVAIPAGAISNKTKFRWIQKHPSATNSNNWGLDNININSGNCLDMCIVWSNGLQNVTSFNYVGITDTCFIATVYDLCNQQVGVDTVCIRVNQPILTTINDSICLGQSYLFNNTYYTSSINNIQDTLKTATGCDSIVTLNLTVLPALTGTEAISICEGSSYVFNGITYTSNNNTAKDTLKTANGCDSIVTLNLTVRPALTGTEAISICEGSSYVFNGITYTTANNTAKDTLKTANGCDSIVTLNLTVRPALSGTEAISICEGSSYVFNGITYTSDNNTAKDTLKTANGCDSIVTLNLTVLPALTGTEIVSICAGSSYVFNGITYTSDNNTATDTLKTANGCDSIVTLNLTVRPALTGTEIVSICAGSSYVFNGITYTSDNNTAKDTLKTANGCDSIVTLNLMVLPALTGTEIVSICAGSSYVFNGITYTSDNNTAKDTLKTANGCDSIVTLNLTVRPALTGTQVVSICEGSSYVFNGITYTTANNTAKDTLKTATGCDSIVTLNLTVRPALTGTEIVSICAGSSYVFNGITYTSDNNTAIDTLKTANGCDSIVTLNLTVLPALTGTEIVSICAGSSYVFNGITYTSDNNTATDTLKTANGCDSIVTLNLTVRPALTGTEIVSICEGSSYVFNGIIYTTANNTAKDTLKTANGCDSIVTLNLSIIPRSYSVLDTAICEGSSIIFNGVSYNMPNNTATDTLTNILGCDSIIRLNLSIIPRTYAVKNVTICNGESYTFNGITYTASNTTATDTLVNVSGCDSIITLNLIVNPTSVDTIDTYVCYTDLPYIFDNTAHNNSGYYTFRYKNINQCDSIIVLNLTVSEPTRDTIITIQNCDSVSFEGTTYHSNITIIDTLFNAALCDSLYREIRIIINKSNLYTTTASICSDQSYYFHDRQFNSSGIYEIKYVNMFGCDSIYRLHLIVNPIPNIILKKEDISRHCIGDTIAIYVSGARNYTSEGYIISSNEDTLWAKLFFAENQYEITGYDSNGCINKAQINISAENCCEVGIPNAFSPNNDGLNDTYQILVPGNPKNYKLMIYNKYGQVVFHSVKPNEGWDGYMGDKKVESGVYYYILETECPDGTTSQQKGDITLIR